MASEWLAICSQGFAHSVLRNMWLGWVRLETQAGREPRLNAVIPLLFASKNCLQM